MIEYLLDTNILSEIGRAPDGAAAAIFLKKQDRCATSIFVAAEMRFGVRRRPGKRILARVEETLAGIPVLAFEEPADSSYAEIRAALEQAGTPIGANDLWIAAHALALDLTLVTANEREFRRVPGLKVENWLG
jgi:tRNA(fMet)-specific endonuclease VapC